MKTRLALSEVKKDYQLMCLIWSAGLCIIMPLILLIIPIFISNLSFSEIPSGIKLTSLGIFGFGLWFTVASKYLNPKDKRNTIVLEGHWTLVLFVIIVGTKNIIGRVLNLAK